MVHPDGRSEEPTLSDWVLAHYPALKGVGEPLVLSSGEKIERHGIVHRIDRETSGALVLCKDQETFLYVKSLFQERHVTKVYNAFVWGAFKEKEGIVDLPIGRSRKDFRRRSARRDAKGIMREAQTRYRVLEENGVFSYLELKPETGRTHQIRVHMSAIDHPLVCDRLYAPKRPCKLGFARAALHARSIAFSLENGEKVFAEAPLPADFEEGLSRLRRIA